MKIPISTHRGGPVTYVDLTKRYLEIADEVDRRIPLWPVRGVPWWQTWVLPILIILGVTAVAAAATLRLLGAI